MCNKRVCRGGDVGVNRDRSEDGKVKIRRDERKRIWKMKNEKELVKM